MTSFVQTVPSKLSTPDSYFSQVSCGLHSVSGKKIARTCSGDGRGGREEICWQSNLCVGKSSSKHSMEQYQVLRHQRHRRAELALHMTQRSSSCRWSNVSVGGGGSLVLCRWSVNGCLARPLRMFTWMCFHLECALQTFLGQSSGFLAVQRLKAQIPDCGVSPYPLSIYLSAPL